MTRNMHLTTDFLSLLRSFDNDKHIFFTGVPRYALHRLPMVCRSYRANLDNNLANGMDCRRYVLRTCTCLLSNVPTGLIPFNFPFSIFNFNSGLSRSEFSPI